MANTAIVYTPRNGAQKTLNLGTYPIVTRFVGFVTDNRRQSVTIGGKAVTLTNDSWHEYEVEQNGLGPDKDAAVFKQVTAWLSEARAGVAFSFAMDDTKDTSTLLNGAIADTDTSVTVDDTTGWSASDWLFIEDADDPTQYERAKISTVDSGTDITLTEGVRNAYADNSPIRSAEYFPTCLLLEDRFTERPGGQGAGLWDLRFRFRTVR